MATSTMEASLEFIVSVIFYALLHGSGALCDESVPGIYVFGDSLVDVGNNNHLSLSILKANFPHNGVDFPTGEATGRFSNGKNVADFLAERVGLSTAPPYLSLVSDGKKLGDTSLTVTGVSFASGGAGILNGTNKNYQSIPMAQQVGYYSLVHEQLVQQLGLSGAQTHLANSLFVVVIGSNDLIVHFDGSNATKEYTPQQYIDLMASTLKQLIKIMYGLGARKFVVAGVGAIGCCPKQRIRNIDKGCNVEINYWSTRYNDDLTILLKELKVESPDINYSYFDTYGIMSNLIQEPDNYGLTEIKEACCGIGDLKADIACIPISNYCSNRSDHLFWDIYHPTEMVSRMFAELMYNGSQQFTFPMNVKQLGDM